MENKYAAFFLQLHPPAVFGDHLREVTCLSPQYVLHILASKFPFGAILVFVMDESVCLFFYFSGVPIPVNFAFRLRQRQFNLNLKILLA